LTISEKEKEVVFLKKVDTTKKAIDAPFKKSWETLAR